MAATIDDMLSSLDEDNEELNTTLNRDKKYSFYFYEMSRALYSNKGKEYSLKEIEDNLSHIKEKKDSFEKLGTTTAEKKLFEELTAYFGARKEILSAYDKNECIADGALDSDCAAKVDDSMADSLSDASKIEQQIKTLSNYYKSVIRDDAFMVYDKYGKQDNE